MSTWQTQTLLIPAGHPSAAGHFPGNPIVPGALLLDAMLAAMQAAIGGAQSGAMLRNAKFLRPVRHGQALQLRWLAEPGGVRFECRLAAEGDTVMSGLLVPVAASAP